MNSVGECIKFGMKKFGMKNSSADLEECVFGVEYGNLV